MRGNKNTHSPPPVRRLLIIFCMTSSILLSGCWDLKDPQDIHYFTAVAFDYVDNRFRVYVQMIDFASISTPESDKTTDEIPVWVGKGVGDTAASAFNALHDSSQLRVFYGHVNAIILSENIMRRGIDNILDLISRYHELRYTPWVFGTSENLDELLSTTPFFNLSPVSSMLHQPKEKYKQKSVIAPIMLREFISSVREPGNTALLPAIGVVEDDWRAANKPKALLEQNGLYTFYSNKVNGSFRVDDIMGLRWVTPTTNRSPLVIRHQGKVYSEVSLRSPDVKITPRIEDGKVKYHMDVRMKGEVIEVIEPISEQKMKQLAEEHVKEEIISTFEHGLEQGVDLYQLEHVLYVKHTNWWKQHSVRDKPMLPDQDSLTIKVEIEILSAGKMKLFTESSTRPD